MKKNGILSLLLSAVVAFGLLAATIVAGYRPQLGLDLQGGISVVLQPLVNGKRVSNIKQGTLETTKQIIENRVNEIGAVEPDVTVQGQSIVVQIPGIKDQQRALEQVGDTAELRFRPVLEALGPALTKGQERQIARLRKKLKVPEGKTGFDVLNAELVARGQPAIPNPYKPESAPTTDPNAIPVTDPNAPPSSAVPDTTAPAAPPTSTPSGEGTGGSRAAKVQHLRGQDPSTTTTADATATTVAGDSGATTTVAPTTTTSTTTTTIDPAPKNEWGINVYKDAKGDLSPDFQKLLQLESADAASRIGTTASADDLAENEVVLVQPAYKDEPAQRYRLGPTLLTGNAIDDASSGLNPNGQWEVRPTFKGGADGIDKFNAAATKCNTGDPTCPTRQLAIVLDSKVISAPTIEQPTFSRDQITISGSFDQESAKDLATKLQFGALPLTLEPQTIQTVSATLGSGALDAGLIAGAIGIALVAMFLILYYRLLGLVTIGALCIEAAIMWTFVSFMGEHFGLTLTLAGIVGIIVSVGISLDSAVVYFENLKEDVRGGKTVRSSVDKTYSTSLSTILKADVSSLIGAGVLWALSIGPVRGFALFLFISTVLDLVTSYFFTRPVVSLVGRSRLSQHPPWLGIPMADLQPAVLGAEDGVGGAAVQEEL
ncbi:MAG: protein translocase subunit SecD [Microthrixaceae bacterium]|nr:protein translocase subunit SecD [Microthrixaceae bacterium]